MKSPQSDHVPAPGTEKPRRFRPKRWHELIHCGRRGHTLVGTDAAELRLEDALFARDSGGLRWYRCLRCDSWLPLPPPERPSRQHPPSRHEIALPLRGRPLRDRYVMRLIAVDRLVLFLILSTLAAVILLFASNRAVLNEDYTKILKDLQGGAGGSVSISKHGIAYGIRPLFTVNITSLYLTGAAVAAYAALEGAEAIGLWLGKRWAEYLTFVSTIAFIPVEAYELSTGIAPAKIAALAINVAIVSYLLPAKRLFGLRGGIKALRAEREAHAGWPAIERATPKATPEPL
jgi:uncharacterized membrane protein (DUF2068 family)